jgi:ABC-2 type transport system ATP-binding protein
VKPALELIGVRKSYGERVALDGLAFTVPRGSITGLIGPNGAGKTTCFGVVGGLVLPDEGKIDVLGRGPFLARRDAGLLGLLPQDSELPGHTRVEHFLRYLARLQGCTRAEAAREVDRVLELVALRDRRGSRLRELSHGMRRRVAVAQALLGKPELVLLDEPVSGLDPSLVAQMRDVLRAQRDRHGTSLLVSSHQLAELEAVCDHVVFVEAGRTVQSGSLAEVTGRSRLLRYSLERAPELATLQARLPDLELRYDGAVLHATPPNGQAAGQVNARVLPVLLELDAGVLEVLRGGTLEAAYLSRDAKKE